MKKEALLKILRLISINVALVAVLLVLADPFLAKNEENDIKVARSLRLREFGPNRSMWVNPAGHDVDTALLDSKTYFLKTDVNGFIMGPDDDSTALPEIVFFGGSTTECIFVDDSLRFPYLTSRIIEKRTNKKIVTRNYGYGGNHSFHSLVNLFGTGLRLKPEVIVWMHNINDLNLLARTGSYYEAPANRRFYFEEGKEAEIGFVARVSKMIWAIGQTFIPNTLERLYKVKVQRSTPKDEWHGYRNLPPVPFEKVESEFLNSLRSFIALSQANNISVVLMTQFNCFRIENSTQRSVYEKANPGQEFGVFIQNYKRLNDEIRRIAAETSTSLIDLDRLVSKDEKFYYDGVHVNNAGSKLVSQIVADHLVKFQTLSKE